MIRIIVAISLAGAGAFVPSAAAYAQSNVQKPQMAMSTAPQPPKSQVQIMRDVTAESDGIFSKYMADAHVPGLVYGVVQGGKLAYVKPMGIQDISEKRAVTPDTRFRIASMTKAFTALAILQLRDKGKLSLDDLAEKHVPEMRGWVYPTSDSPRIRIRDLLHHVGGMVTDDPWGDRQQVLTEAEFTAMIKRGVPFSRVPQQAHEYSNYGYALLGRIIAKTSGMSYRSYVEQNLLKPLGMMSSGFEVRDVPADVMALGYRWENDAWVQEPVMRDGAFNAMGGLYVTANDYAKWVSFLLSAWPARNDAEAGPVKRATVREMAQGLNFVQVQNRTGSSGATACKQAAAYAMGFRVAADCDLGLTMAHGGGYPGYGSHLMLMPEMGVAVFALSNRTYAGPSAPAWDTAVAMQKAGLLTKRTAPITPAVRQMLDLAKSTYGAGKIEGNEDKLAMNFLMDRSKENWAKELAKMNAQLGACNVVAEEIATGALSANFKWTCEKGVMEGQVLLAPTSPPTLQALRYRPQVAVKAN
jgi:CubicO group peptidase (beta-lactamase class C family)